MTYQWVDVSTVSRDDKEKIHQYFLNNFQGLHQVGSGSNCKVYLYKNFAIKAFKKEARSKNDFTVLSQLQSISYFPYLFYGVKTYDWEYIVIEYLNGENLLNYNGGFLQEKVVDAVTWAFYAALEQGYMLNDIIFENIMVLPNGDIKFIDVGGFIEVPKNVSHYDSDINKHYTSLISLFNI